MVFYTDQQRDIPNPEYLTRHEQERFAEQFDANLATLVKQPGEITDEPEAKEWFKHWFGAYRRKLRSLPDNLRNAS